jgi:hypothetical protein
MPSHDNKSVSHLDSHIRELLAACPSIASHLDLSDGPNFVLGQVGSLLRDGKLEASLERCIYEYLNSLANGDLDAQNLLVVNVLEVLGDTPEAEARAKEYLKGEALLLFERVLRGWI